MTEEQVNAYWQKFLSILPADSSYPAKDYIAEGWGDSPEMADELGELIARGIKTATCSALWEWEAEVRQYDEVDSDFAQAEGEGDFSLEYWREVHRDFFSRTLPKIGREFSEKMPLVCERFQVIYK